jgi:FKBP-type peptidyl-prolyl cis-trans isomerase FkpA
MRKSIMWIVWVALWIFLWGCSPEPPKTEEQKAFYSIGVHLSKQLSVLELTPDELKYVQQGMADGTAGKKLAAEPEAYAQKIQSIAQERITKATEKNKAQAKAFLEKAAAEQGAKKTASGLIFKDIKVGDGAQAKPTDVVKVHYVGTLIDGKEFDSSVKRGQPVEFPLGQIIPCWSEGVSMMKVGGKAKLVCPPELAYGDRGRPPVIPGGSALVFEVELLEIKSGAAAAAPAPAAPPKPAPAPKADAKK